MKNDENVLLVCHPVDAEYLLVNKPEFKDVLVITSSVPVGELTIVPKQEFLDYLNDKLDYRLK